MVHLHTLEAMRRKYRDNLSQYIREHPREFVLFEKNSLGIQETFYKSKRKLKSALKKYHERIGPTFLVEQIPSKIERNFYNNL